MTDAEPGEPLLAVQDLAVEFAGAGGAVRAVDGVSWSVARGGALGVVGESGCGKSVTALSILRLVRAPGRIVGGTIRYRGQDLLSLPEKEMRSLRGNRLAMIFQEPMTALNPVYRAGAQVGEVLRAHRGMGRREAIEEAARLFRQVGIADPERRVHDFPHQMSGGMRQRVMIAMALACRPEVLIADEPTTALDVTIQAQILDLLGRLRRELGMSLVLITHDLGVVAETCDEVVVMYAGQVVEQAPASVLFAMPRHPYTAGLLRAVPLLGAGARTERLREIPGMVPRLDRLPVGCRFQDRCERVEERCRQEMPPLVVEDGRAVRCFVPLATPPGGAV
ncbi:MAG TPA: ABC transporter ATP-binding protein [Polyangia bacterium]|jgi:peptide/nickel transport system ATP-binding protein|nr:ABC transporter ATP-binding protein [Polyangia bacterium]